MKRLISISLAFLLMALAGALLGMGSQGALYAGAKDLISLMSAWQKECSGKTDDADCSRNLAALRKQAFDIAKFADELATEQLDGDSTPDGKNGWRAHWRMYAQLFKYHGESRHCRDSARAKGVWHYCACNSRRKARPREAEALQRSGD